MQVSKDHSIIMQVAGKIAADIVPKSDDVNRTSSDWLVAFDVICEALFEKMGIDTTADTSVPMEVAVANAFPTATVIHTAQQYAQPAQGGTVRIKGTQHGPVPAWLAGECAKKGVTEVWDNRDGLTVNPKRPWFKSTTGTDAFWEPKARR
jgi:hypothetical protein